MPNIYVIEMIIIFIPISDNMKYYIADNSI